MDDGYIDSDGIKLYYRMMGEGEPLLLLNGGPGFPHEYLQEMKALAPYARLIFYDQRGTGNSDKADPTTYTVEANVEDLENLRKALGLEKVWVLGHSWGGMLAQEYTLKYPEHVTKLILANTLASSKDIDATLARMLAAVPAETRAVIEECEAKGLYSEGDTYPAEYQAACDVAYEPVQIGIEPPDYLKNSFARIAYDVYRTMWGRMSEFRVTGTLKEFDAYPRLNEVRVPTLVIVGASDMPTVEMAERMRDAIPGAKLEVFENSRHFPFLEEPQKFVQVVGEFLQEK